MMPYRVRDHVDDPLLRDMPRALRRWGRTDPRLAALARAHRPPPRQLGSGAPFAALVESLTHQQVSLAAGRTIFARVAAAAGGAVTPESVLALGPDGLRAAGLSRSKAAYVLDLGARITSGSLDFERLRKAPDAEAIAALTEVKGIGVWTAKMFLLFHLARPDVLAHEDLGLQIAAAKAWRVPRARAARFLERRAPLWSPYNSLASLVLWHSRRVAEP